MKEYLNWSIVGALALIIVAWAVAQKPQSQSAAVLSAQPIPSTQPSTINVQPQPSRMDRPLRLAVTVDDPSFLQVKEGDEVKSGDVITDNKLERLRLTKQQSSVKLHIQNLKDKPIHKPFEPKKPIPSKQLPRAIFSEEEAAISQAQLRRDQAQSVLEARTSLLKSENPQESAEVDKAEAALQSAAQKVEEQQQLILSIQDMKLADQILQHEDAKLKQLTSSEEQSKSELERAKAKLEATGIQQGQQLQQLQIAVRIAQSELEVAKSRLTAAQQKRKLLEYDASIEQTKLRQQENQTQQEYSRQMQQYETASRDRDYQLAQLNISLSSIEDKLSQIPVVRSPRNGYIRRIKPWVGNNGKYTTTVTISLTPNALSTSSHSQGEKTTSSFNTTTSSKQSNKNTTTARSGKEQSSFPDTDSE